MIVRALDTNSDWTFGASLNNYLNNTAAVIQNINTRLQEFLGDCFFNTGAGINWFNLLGNKNQVALNLAITNTILNTDQVISLSQLSINLNDISRNISISYTVNTTYGQQTNLLIINPTASI